METNDTYGHVCSKRAVMAGDHSDMQGSASLESLYRATKILGVQF